MLVKVVLFELLVQKNSRKYLHFLILFVVWCDIFVLFSEIKIPHQQSSLDQLGTAVIATCSHSECSPSIHKMIVFITSSPTRSFILTAARITQASGLHQCQPRHKQRRQIKPAWRFYFVTADRKQSNKPSGEVGCPLTFSHLLHFFFQTAGKRRNLFVVHGHMLLVILRVPLPPPSSVSLKSIPCLCPASAPPMRWRTCCSRCPGPASPERCCSRTGPGLTPTTSGKALSVRPRQPSGCWRRSGPGKGIRLRSGLCGRHDVLAKKKKKISHNPS